METLTQAALQRGGRGARGISQRLIPTQTVTNDSQLERG